MPPADSIAPAAMLDSGATLKSAGVCDGIVLTADWDNTAKIFDSSTGECKLTLSGHDDMLNSAVFSADRSSVLTASFDNTAKIFDSSTGECKLTFSEHDDVVNSAVFSPDGSSVLTTSNDTAMIFDSST